jgi:hypothetical protein
MDCYKHFSTIFENSSDELGTGNTRHFRKSIVNDESDERQLNHCMHQITDFFRLRVNNKKEKTNDEITDNKDVLRCL